MTYTLTVTSQGQVSIPAELRRLWNLVAGKQLIITLRDKKVATMKPSLDLLSLGGSLNKYSIKNKTIDQIIKFEEDAVGDAVVEKYLRKEKRSGNKLLTI